MPVRINAYVSNFHFQELWKYVHERASVMALFQPLLTRQDKNMLDDVLKSK